jgi:two-component system sensor histidine kinase CreC
VRIRVRIFLAFAVTAAFAVWYLSDHLSANVRMYFLQGMEESLVDTSTVLASLLEEDVRAGKIDAAGFRRAFRSAYRRKLDARIYELVKTDVDLRVYVTDAKGVVIFDSDGGRAEGEDYSEWNDVYLCLRGEYGGRVTRRVEGDPRTSVMCVASPVRSDGKLVGVLSACKPVDHANFLIDSARTEIMKAAVIAAALLMVLGYLVSYWVVRPVRRLTAFAREVSEGRRAPAPDLGKGEIAQMGRAFARMRDELEGRRYVEQYVGTLTHEIKAPLSAIRGAAELLGEDVPPEKRQKFLENIRAESERISQVVDRLLELASLENRRELRDVAELDGAGLAAEARESLAAAAESAGVTIRAEAAEGLALRGEKFLLAGALANMLRNAIEFSSPGGEVLLRARAEGDGILFEVLDSGPGVPDFALGRAFEKFYSLPRPGGGKKSSGLGLSFVREAADLHGGEAGIENRPEAGARCWIRLPRGPEKG